MENLLRSCALCPRECKIDRTKGEKGCCLGGANATVAKIMVHKWEEPCISGTRGTGAVFFSGCNLHCVYCQNAAISGKLKGEEYTPEKLAEVFLDLQEQNVHTLDLVTPTHFAVTVAKALEIAKPRLNIPVVYNTGGYEKPSTLRLFEGLVDVYLPDLKYYSPELSEKYSSCPDYFEKASEAIKEMIKQVGVYTEDEKGIVKKGVIVRHLLLPSHRKDSAEVLEKLSELTPPETIRLSLMSQYTPDFVKDDIKELKRRVTTFEYDFVLEKAASLGFVGYCQEKTSADKKYTPDF